MILLKPLNIYLAVLIFVVTPSGTSAQIGWKWAMDCIGSGNDTLPSGFDFSGTLALDKHGNIAVSGFIYGPDSVMLGSSTFHPIHPATDQVTFAKVNGSHYLWAVTTGGSTLVSHSTALAADDSDNTFALGIYESGSFSIGPFTLSTSGYNAYYLAKISPSGTVLWATNISTIYGGVAGLGAACAVVPGNICVDGKGDIYAAVAFSDISLNFGSAIVANTDATGMTCDILLLKYSPSGRVIWSKSFKGNKADAPNTLVLTGREHLYLSGVSNSDSMSFGTATLTATGSYWGASASGYINFMSKFDTAGNLIWLKKVDPHLGINGMVADDSENLYISGYIDSTVIMNRDTLNCQAGYAHFTVAKFDSSGNAVWGDSASNLGGEAGVGQGSIGVDPCGNTWVMWPGDSIFIAGHFLWAPFSPGHDNVILAEFNNAGAFLQGMVLSGGADDVSAIVVDGSGNFYVAGDYYTTGMKFGPDSLPRQPGEQLFVARYRYDINGCPAEVNREPSVSNIHSTVSVFPNPAHALMSVRSDGQRIEQLELFNILGQKIYSEPIQDNSGQITIDVSELPVGMYLVRINGAGTCRFLKE